MMNTSGYGYSYVDFLDQPQSENLVYILVI